MVRLRLSRESIGWFIFSAILTLLGVAIIKIFCKMLFSFSDVILAITALVLLWYTYETHVIAKANEENQKQSRKPTVNYVVYTHSTDRLETMFKVVNNSNNPVAVRLNCSIKIDGEPLGVFKGYDGDCYWNLQYRQEKTGHFSFIDLLVAKGMISSEVRQEIRLVPAPDSETRYGYAIAKLFDLLGPDLPKITMDVDIFCQNEADVSYYPPSHYKYDYPRKRWIPELLSSRPFWEYDQEPEWVRVPPSHTDD